MKKINFSLFLVFLCIPLISFGTEDCSYYGQQIRQAFSDIKNMENQRDELINKINSLQTNITIQDNQVSMGDSAMLDQARQNEFANRSNRSEVYGLTLKEGVLLNEISIKKSDLVLLQMKYDSCINELNRMNEAQTYIDNFFKNLQSSGFILKDSDKIGILQLTLKNQSTVPDGWIAYQAQRKKEHNAIRFRKIKKDLKK